jgi:hypothetical protein
MKTAYELAMERLAKNAPSVKLTTEQKSRLAELDSLYTAKSAERDLVLKSEIAKAEEKGDLDEMAKLQAQLAEERKKLQAELEEKKEQVRQGKL